MGGSVRTAFACLCLVALGAKAAAPASKIDRPRLFVSALSAQGVEPEQARAFTDAVVASLSERGLFEVISTKDLETLLGVPARSS